MDNKLRIDMADKTDKACKESGFSLLEISITLAIMGIIIGLGVPPLLNILNLGKVRTTEKHQEAVMTALAAYGLQNGYLPCPASLENPGHAAISCMSEGKMIGSIPYYTLGLPVHFAYDGFKRPMLYAVNSVIVDQKGKRETKVELRQQINTIVAEPEINDIVTNNLHIRDMKAKRGKKIEVPIIHNKLVENVKKFCNTAELSVENLLVYNENHQAIMTVNQENFVAVVLISDDLSTAKQLNVPSPFIDHPYAKDHPYILKWASRDFLSSFYGQYSCVHSRLNNIQLNTQLKFQ